jgi:hypothetical protein
MSKGIDRANVENKAMRGVLGLMGFDARRVIQMMTDNEQARWMRAIFSGVSVEIDPLKMKHAGASDQSIESMRVIFNGLRKPEGNHV